MKATETAVGLDLGPDRIDLISFLQRGLEQAPTLHNTRASAFVNNYGATTKAPRYSF